MNNEYVYLPEPHSMPLLQLCMEVEKGAIKIPQFQRDFVWSKQKSAELLDSILKGYPIGTFIFWKTKETLREVRNIGGIELPKSPKGDFVHYVLDGQQRLTSLFAAVKGVKIHRSDDVDDDFGTFHVDLKATIDEVVVVPELDENADPDRWIQLFKLLHGRIQEIVKYSDDAQNKIQAYKDRLNSYQFPIVTLKEAPIEIATEVFTRLNVGGKPLSMFEIMVAKTYDAERRFDLSEQYEVLLSDLEKAGYGTLPSSVVLQTVAACLAKDTKKKAILGLNKKRVIDEWETITDAIKRAIDFLRASVGVPVSQLLPYPSLLVPFAYYFYKSKASPQATASSRLQEFFWRVGLGERYSRSLDTKIVQDLKRIDAILSGKQPKYDWEVDTSPEFIGTNGYFSTGRAYIKTMLCLLASNGPLSFRNNSKVNISNDWLSRSNSKNYHHFFPKSYLKKKEEEPHYINHIVNITLVDDQLNKAEIGAKAPSKYIAIFGKRNPSLKKALASHYIGETTFGIAEDDYDKFFNQRAKRLSRALERKLNINP